MISKLYARPAVLNGTRWQDLQRTGASARSRPVVAVGLGVIVSLILVGLAFLAGALVVHAVSARLFSGQLAGGSALTTAGQEGLTLRSNLVEQRRAALTTYAAKLTDFKRATARPPGAVGINLDAAEATRRDLALTGLMLDCIDAVDGYNLAALGRSATQLRSAGLPAGYVWPVDCALGQ